MARANVRPLAEKTEERVPSWGNAGVPGSQCGVTVGPVRSPHEAWKSRQRYLGGIY